MLEERTLHIIWQAVCRSCVESDNDQTALRSKGGSNCSGGPEAQSTALKAEADSDAKSTRIASIWLQRAIFLSDGAVNQASGQNHSCDKSIENWTR